MNANRRVWRGAMTAARYSAILLGVSFDKMIYREKIYSALESCASEFALYDAEMRAQVASYQAALEAVSRLSREEVAAKLPPDADVGALPTEEFFAAQSFVLPFNISFADREAARHWAYEKLLNVTTFAADGSQILPSKDFSIPVAAVQVGWFENPHTADGEYVKDAAFEVIPPDRLLVRTGGDIEASEQVVHRRRYAMEVQAICHYLTAAAARGFAPERPPVVFFDSSLINSFAALLPEEQRDFYVREILALLKLSKATGIPVIGYVDRDLARDLVNMLQRLLPELSESPKLQDAPLLAERMRWGDRTPLFRCARQGILASYGDEWRRELAFCYLKTSADAPPARLDVPMWVAERGLLDWVVDIARGEVIIGNGYPYVIEAADQTAVISHQERETFYALFQEYAAQAGLDLRRARKAISKAQRR